MQTAFKISVASCLIAAAATAASARQPITPPSPETIRASFLKLIDRPRVALEPAVRSRPETGGLVAEEISFAAEAGQRVPTLLIKQSGSSLQPAVIVLHGTGGSKEGLAGRLRDLAGKGFVAVAIDGRYHGERAGPSSEGMSPYLAAILRTYRTGREHPFLYDTVWDVMRLIDYLETRPDVDRARIALTGISKGGMETYLAAAVDPRIAVAVPMIGVQSFRWALDHGAWDSRAWTLREAVDAAAKDAGSGVGAPFMRRFYDKVAPGVYGEFDGPSMLPLIAPRPLLSINGEIDPRTPMPGLQLCADAARAAYRAARAEEKFVLHVQPNTGHKVLPESMVLAREWLVKWLKP